MCSLEICNSELHMKLGFRCICANVHIQCTVTHTPKGLMDHPTPAGAVGCTLLLSVPLLNYLWSGVTMESCQTTLQIQINRITFFFWVTIDQSGNTSILCLVGKKGTIVYSTGCPKPSAMVSYMMSTQGLVAE